MSPHLRVALALLLALLPAVPGVAVRAEPLPGTSCPFFPADNILNADIATLPVHPQSATWKGNMAQHTLLHPDFGTTTEQYGIPINVAPPPSPGLTPNFLYNTQSDYPAEGYPIDQTTLIEGGPGASSGSDRHALVVDKNRCKLYEIYNLQNFSNGQIPQAGSGAVWSLSSDAMRAIGWTSADAAGLPIAPLLLRPDEILAGSITHAIRFTAHCTHSYTWPASHDAGLCDSTYPPMGARFRLSSGYDISGFSTNTQVVLRAFQHFGLILADNGSDWYFQGTTDDWWGTTAGQQVVAELKTIPASQFDAVDQSGLQVSATSYQAAPPTGGWLRAPFVRPPPASDRRVARQTGVPAPAPPGYSVPGAPTGVTAAGGVGSATITWTAPASNGGSPITGYTVTSSLVETRTVSANLTQALFTGLTSAPRSFTVTADNTFGASAPSAPSNTVTPVTGGTYHPLVPARILDTRSAIGVPAPAGPLGPGQSLDLQVSGQGGVPASGVSSVVLNVTVTDTSASSYLSVWPQGVSRPVVSSLNWTPGDTVANLVEVALGATGRVSFFNPAGSTDVIADVQGYVGDSSDSYSRTGLFNPLTPGRDLDTRSGVGAPSAPIGPGGVLNLTVLGANGVPAAGVSAVVLNVTAVNPSAGGYLTVWPAGAARPTASNLNFLPGQIVPNRVTVGVGAGGQVSIYNPAGSVDVVADVNGWFTDQSSTAGGSAFNGEVPKRIFDTRDCGCPIPPGDSLPLYISQPFSTPHTALALNVTAVNPTQAGYLTVYPDDGSWAVSAHLPIASDLNFTPAEVVPNLTMVKLGPSQYFGFDTYNPAGFTDVVYDEDGYYGALVTAPPAWAT